MDYASFIHSLFQHQAFTDGEFTLDPMRAALERVSNPQASFPCVLVAGTNGKGTTASLLVSLLEARGVRTGLYTSPHLVDPRERFRVGGLPVSQDEVLRVGLEAFARFGPPNVPSEVRAHAPHDPEITLTLFELTTWMALCLFRDHAVDIAVLEVGLGGRLDATNAVDPALSIITTIGLDHMAILGDTHAQIAREKAGILRPQTPALLGPMSAEARAAIQSVADALPTSLCDVHPNPDQALPLWLRGAFESHVALAQRAVDELASLGLAPHAAPDGDERVLKNARWPGRRDAVVCAHGPLRGAVLLDGAHNPDGAESFVHWLQERDRAGLPRARCGLIAMMADKDAHAVARVLVHAPVDGWVVTSAPHRRARDAASLAEVLQSAGFCVVAVESDAEDAMRAARESATQDSPVAVCGSLFLVAEVIRSAGVGSGFWALMRDSSGND